MHCESRAHEKSSNAINQLSLRNAGAVRIVINDLAAQCSLEILSLAISNTIAAAGWSLTNEQRILIALIIKKTVSRPFVSAVCIYINTHRIIIGSPRSYSIKFII
jgi:hypothetical protein